MGTIKEILEGWGNVVKDKFGTLNEETKIMAEIRMEQCHSCSNRKGNVCDPTKQIKHIVNKQMVWGCGCNLTAKTLSPDSECPAGKW
jgi:hypothetical protein